MILGFLIVLLDFPLIFSVGRDARAIPSIAIIPITPQNIAYGTANPRIQRLVSAKIQ